MLTICYVDADFSASFLCDHCGQKFISNQGLKTHFSGTHDKSFLLLINYKSIFSETAKLLNYPDKLDLPNRIETKINYLFENYEKDDLLRQISVSFKLIGMHNCTSHDLEAISTGKIPDSFV